MNPISVYCINIETINGKIEYECLNILEDVLYLEMTPKPKTLNKVKKSFSPPPGIPLFCTANGKYIQLHSMEAYQKALMPYKFDLFMPSTLVNTAKVDFIEESIYGNTAYFKGASDIWVPVSKNKTREYEHLLKKVF
ncbi:hypothetical protein ABEW34_21405 [Paenibacillus algorifonticola]|uniref:hypothetical protein n=1 Tax=Paenibacillus algorifonticola TaxID=684063 RepID=UPI003D297E05